MNAAPQYHRRSVAAAILIVSLAVSASASTRLVLSRGEQPPSVEYKGVIEITAKPGFDDARVSITVDGQRIADSLQAPYKVIVDFGPTAIEHRIGVTATGAGKRRIQWAETVNRGHLQLSVKVRLIDLNSHLFEASTTAPVEDPVAVVELWDTGKLVASVSDPPYRFTVPSAVLASGFVQITARAKSGEEAADFW